MDKVLSIRPTVQISMLFDEIKAVEAHQESDRSAIVNRALEIAASKNIDWKAVSKQRIKENVVEATPPAFMKIRVEEKYYNIVLEEIMKTFSLERVTAPYLVRLLLNFYLSELRKADKEEIINVVERVINIGVDCLVFKKEYDFSHYVDKEKLYQLSKQYLEDCDPMLNTNIRAQVNAKIKEYSDCFNIEKYFPRPRSDFGCCNIVFTAKTLAGLFLIVSEIENYDLDNIVKSLEVEINKRLID